MLDKMPQAMITVDLAWRTEKSGNFFSQTATKNDTQPILYHYESSSDSNTKEHISNRAWSPVPGFQISDHLATTKVGKTMEPQILKLNQTVAHAAGVLKGTAAGESSAVRLG